MILAVVCTHIQIELYMQSISHVIVSNILYLIKKTKVHNVKSKPCSSQLLSKQKYINTRIRISTHECYIMGIVLIVGRGV